jgi:hypothetical protein
VTGLSLELHSAEWEADRNLVVVGENASADMEAVDSATAQSRIASPLSLSRAGLELYLKPETAGVPWKIVPPPPTANTSAGELPHTPVSRASVVCTSVHAVPL